MNTDKAKKLKTLINALFTEEEKEQIRKHMTERKEQIINDTAKAMQDFTDGLKAGLTNNHKENQ